MALRTKHVVRYRIDEGEEWQTLHIKENRMIFPASRDFYDVVRDIANFNRASILVNGQPINYKDFLARYPVPLALETSYRRKA